MNSVHLHLDLGGSWLQARLVQSRGWLRHRSECLLTSRRVMAPGTPLDEALRRLGAELTDAGMLARGARLRAAVGLPHAYIGLMKLAQDAGTRLDASALQGYVTAWVEHTLHRDPAADVVRWQVLRNPSHVLVSCIARSTFDALAEFAAMHALRFDSCIPAVMAAIRNAERERTRLLAWTEGIGDLRDSIVQLLCFDGGQVHAAWRGWVPVAEGDSQLHGALARFLASQGPAEDTPAAHLHWPARQVGVSATG